ncbi:zf-HC2 domain-containing protein [Paenibacillus sp. GCM10027627]|uniref:zf-HC2 domain-containing protein n=1 Tax=unclassified Paenibacillus TaxID=185978 RepID=UPI00363A5026
MSETKKGHLTTEQLYLYIRGEMSPQERERVDEELLVCEGCLWQFMAAMEEAERGGGPSPLHIVVPDMDRIEEQIMAELMHGSNHTIAERPLHHVSFPAEKPEYSSSEANVDNPAAAKLEAERAQNDIPHGDNYEQKLVPKELQKEQPIERDQRSKKKKYDSWLQHPATHYTIAASITILLLATGALASFSEGLQRLDKVEQQEPPYSIGSEWVNQPTWSDRLVDQAGSWLDGVQKWRFK